MASKKPAIPSNLYTASDKDWKAYWDKVNKYHKEQEGKSPTFEEIMGKGGIADQIESKLKAMTKKKKKKKKAVKKKSGGIVKKPASWNY